MDFHIYNKYNVEPVYILNVRTFFKKISATRSIDSYFFFFLFFSPAFLLLAEFQKEKTRANVGRVLFILENEKCVLFHFRLGSIADNIR